ncbi:MAG: TIGR02646 family protein [Candidatus Nealsonbacteria bacterium]|nr:TIGR02646 family protein [Candidatus Nealsonbacteria bacterium]
MKYINKGAEPEVLSQYKARANDEWEPTFKDLPGEKKRKLHRQLVDEQGWLCCYCLARVKEEDSHIEHLHPQSKSPERLALDYGNMLVSCQRDLPPKEPRHCGTLKEDWYEKKLMVSPLQEDCEKRFRFTAYGNVFPAIADDRAARTTIRKLGLDIDRLRALRRGAIDGALDGIDDLSSGEIRKLAAGFLQRDSRGKFPECCVAVAHVLRGLAEPQ